MPNERRRRADAMDRPVTDDAVRRLAYQATKQLEPREDSLPLTGTSGVPPRRTRLSATFTVTPDPPAPQLFCPTCALPLVYRQTVIGGVKPLERWDYFACRTCGTFVYRDRTRRLRRTALTG